MLVLIGSAIIIGTLVGSAVLYIKLSQIERANENNGKDSIER